MGKWFKFLFKRKERISPTKNQNGVAILMVTSSIVLMTLILADFAFETKINEVKIYREQENMVARANAEAGMNYVLTLMKFYYTALHKDWKKDQEAQAGGNSNNNSNNNNSNNNQSNKYQKSKMALDFIKNMCNPKMGGSSLGFRFPPPSSMTTNAAVPLMVRMAMTKIKELIILESPFSCKFSEKGNFLNPNALNAWEKKQGVSKLVEPAQAVWDKLVEILKDELEKIREKDETFDDRNEGLLPENMVAELSFFISKEGEMDESKKADGERKFQELNLSPKQSDLISLDELYLLPSWPEEIINALKTKMDVQKVNYIDVKKLTRQHMTLLFPDQFSEDKTQPDKKEALDQFMKLYNGSQQDNEPGWVKEKSFNVEALKNKMAQQTWTDNERWKTMIDNLKKAEVEFGSDIGVRVFNVEVVAYPPEVEGEVERNNEKMFTLKAVIEIPNPKEKIHKGPQYEKYYKYMPDIWAQCAFEDQDQRSKLLNAQIGKNETVDIEEEPFAGNLQRMRNQDVSSKDACQNKLKSLFNVGGKKYLPPNKEMWKEDLLPPRIVELNTI